MLNNANIDVRLYTKDRNNINALGKYNLNINMVKNKEQKS